MNDKALSIPDLKKEIDKYTADEKTVLTLLETTFKDLGEANVKPALLEGRMRGFSFQDFLEKNIYAIPFGKDYSLVTSIDWARKVGMRSGVVGVAAPIYEMADDGRTIISCEITVKRKVRDDIGEFTAKVYFDEYTTGKNLWTKKPRTMIAKVAEMHALRKACPEELSQAYVEEERTEAPKQAVAIDLTLLEAKLEAATTIEELGRIWADLPGEAKLKLEGVKNMMKVKLVPTVKPEPLSPEITKEETERFDQEEKAKAAITSDDMPFKK